MRYIVILDAKSPVGAIYANGNNDGLTSDGNISHPVLDCTEIETNNPYYIFAKRSPNEAIPSHQILYLPHGSVVMIVAYDKAEDRPVGFLR